MPDAPYITHPEVLFDVISSVGVSLIFGSNKLEL